MTQRVDQNICGVSDCERYADCPFGKAMIAKIDIERPYRLSQSAWPDCLMPPIIPNDPDDGEQARAAA